jgi:hypothetical protein
MVWWTVDFIYRTHLAYTPLVQNHYSIGNGPHDCQIVRDKDIGYVALSLQVRQQIEHRCLDRHIEGGGRFIAKYDLWIGSNSPGNSYALFLAA